MQNYWNLPQSLTAVTVDGEGVEILYAPVFTKSQETIGGVLTLKDPVLGERLGFLSSFQILGSDLEDLQDWLNFSKNHLTLTTFGYSSQYSHHEIYACCHMGTWPVWLMDLDVKQPVFLTTNQDFLTARDEAIDVLRQVSSKEVLGGQWDPQKFKSEEIRVLAAGYSNALASFQFNTNQSLDVRLQDEAGTEKWLPTKDFEIIRSCFKGWEVVTSNIPETESRGALWYKPFSKKVNAQMYSAFVSRGEKQKRKPEENVFVVENELLFDSETEEMLSKIKAYVESIYVTIVSLPIRSCNASEEVKEHGVILFSLIPLKIQKTLTLEVK
ncbi:MAG: hypothetical protein F6J98_01660 [Moorea sp. SIO4G2]|nr:hypothetical protein [Moorena sp. SIO4G2]